MLKKSSKSRKKKTKSKAIIVMVCKDHEDYRAIYPPKRDCLICWKIYATRMRLIVKELKIVLKELKDARR